MQGLNFKQSDILSSLLFGELKNHVRYKKRVIEIYEMYQQKIKNKNILFTPRDLLSVPLYSQVQVLPNQRKSILNFAKGSLGFFCLILGAFFLITFKFFFCFFLGAIFFLIF